MLVPQESKPKILSIKNLYKDFGSIQVIRGVSLEVAAGEVVCLIGPSGGGKSTLLRMINGLEASSAGEIDVVGVKLPGSRRDLQKVRRSVGMVFQSFNLFPHLTILSNLTIAPRRNKGLRRAQANELAKKLLERIGLIDHIHKYPAQLSGGQQQRAAIARALAMEPQLLIFDEPTSALDPENVNEVLSVMKELTDTGITMIVATHEMGFAREAADRVVFIVDGNILVDQPPEKFFSNTTDARLVSFLSKML